MPKPTKKSPKTSLSNGTGGTFGVSSPARALALLGDPFFPATCEMLQSEVRRGHCTYKACASDSPVRPAGTAAAAEIPGKQSPAAQPGQAKPARFLQPSQGAAGMAPVGRALGQRSGAEPAASSCASLHASRGCPGQTRVPARAAERLFFQLIWQISGTSPADYTSSDVLQQRAREKTSEQVFPPGENSPARCKLPSPACAARCSRAGGTARRWPVPQRA